MKPFYLEYIYNGHYIWIRGQMVNTLYPKYSYGVSKGGKQIDRGNSTLALEPLKRFLENEVDKMVDNARSLIAQQINALTREHFQVHLVTCGMCGGIFNELYCTSETEKTEDGYPLVTCPHCKREGDNSENPDLFY